MKSKDQILLEQVYSNILHRENIEVEMSEQLPQDPPFSKNHLEEREEESMAKSNLYAICKHAKSLLDSLEAGTHLEPWQLEKIAVITDNIQDVSQVAEYEAQDGVDDFDIDEIDSMKMESKKVNPWAVCGKVEDKNKKERCVKGVKKSAKKYGKKVTSEPVKKKEK
jgi:hypothetical protein